MRAALLVLTIACGGNRLVSVENRASPPSKPACTEARVEEIRAHLQGRWNTTAALSVRCTAGRFPTPGYFIEASSSELRRTGIVAIDGTTEVVPFDEEVPAPFASSIIAWATVDLDGDGIDEIVETWRRNPQDRMSSGNWLTVRRITARKLSRIVGPHTNVFHPDLGSCTADVRLAGQTIVVTVVGQTSGIPPSKCLPWGPHSFALDGNAIVEIRPNRISRR
jgi:hypothetical protein